MYYAVVVILAVGTSVRPKGLLLAVWGLFYLIISPILNYSVVGCLSVQFNVRLAICN